MASQNPLDKLTNVQHKCILAAFAYTEDACKTDLGSGIGPSGTDFTGKACGKPAVVILNEFVDKKYAVTHYESEFSYYSAISPTTTQMLGQILIADRIGGQFPNFIRKTAQKLQVSESHIAFSLRIFFMGADPQNSGDGTNNVSVNTIATKPLIFNLASLSKMYPSETEQTYALNWVATYNTFGLMPTFSKMYQHTITNVDGNPSKEVPKPDVVIPTIIPRAQEDSAKTSARKTRIDKSKTMETLGQAYDSLAEDLMQQKYEHKRQLQEWLSYVRDDYVKKIAPPKQKKPPGYIPVDYRLNLEGGLRGYKIDNRNMPFEQPEQSQEKYGVRTLSVQDGEHLVKFVERLMKHSRKLSQLAKNAPRQGFKTNICILRRCEGKYDLFMQTYQITNANNTPSSDTGPGTAKSPLVFEYNKAQLGDTNVLDINAKMTSLIDLQMMENQVDDPDAEVVYGNREQATAEKTAQVDFFHSMYSGVRVHINAKNNGLESAEDGGIMDNSLMPNINSQTNIFTVNTRLDPNLMSDLHRNPFWVYQQNEDGAVYYPLPEKNPMYAKIVIYMNAVASDLGIDPDSVDPTYYYVQYYHLYKVRTIINGGGISQELSMLRTDDAT